MSQAYQPLGSFSELPEIQIDGQIHTRAGADPGSLHQKLRNEAALLAMDQLGAITLEGPDTAEFLQRICSQDAQGMAAGQGARACLLSGKGKLLAAFWLWRPAHERFLLEVERPRAGAVLGILDRYLFSENCRIRDLSPELAVIGVVGPGAPELVDGAPAAGQVVARGGGHLVHSTELGVPSIRFVAPRDEADALARELADSGLPLGGFEDFEALRIDAGVPRFGLDADENTIPLEVNLDDALDSDKGCYVGQEVIARIHTYGHVNRKLVRIRIQDAELPAPGTLLYDGDLEAGRLTSAYLSPADGTVHALALLPLAALEEDVELRLGSAGGERVELV